MPTRASNVPPPGGPSGRRLFFLLALICPITASAAPPDRTRLHFPAATPVQPVAVTDVQVGDPGPPVWSITTLPGGSGELAISIETAGFSISPATTGVVLHIPGEAAAAAGTPALPRLVRLLPGQPGATARLELRGLQAVEVTNLDVSASPGYELDDPESPTRSLRPVVRPSPAIYATNAFWPAALGQTEEAWIGTRHVVRVECFPLQYNPATRTVRWYRRLEGTLRFDTAPGTKAR